MTKKQVTKVEDKLPAYLQDYQGPMGSENIEVEDVEIPRIKLGQGTSPEVKDKSVPEGAFFLNVTGQVLAAPGEPLRIVVVGQSKEFILWKDQLFEGGGIFARAHKVEVGGEAEYEWDKPGQTFKNMIKGVLAVEWTTGKYVSDNLMDKFGSSDVKNQDSVPAATGHFNYVVLLPDHDNIVAAISLSNSAFKRGKKFNALLKMPSKFPTFARVYNVTSDDQTNPAGQIYKNWVIKPAGNIEDDLFPVTLELFKQFDRDSFVVDQSRAEGDAATGEGGKF